MVFRKQSFAGRVGFPNQSGKSVKWAFTISEVTTASGLVALVMRKPVTLSITRAVLRRRGISGFGTFELTCILQMSFALG